MTKNRQKMKSFEELAKANSRGRFLRIWIHPFYEAVHGLGEAEFKCCLYLLMARNGKGFIIVQADEIAAAAHVSHDTVCTTISHLINHDLLARVRNGVLMMNPAVVYSEKEVLRGKDYAKYRGIQAKSGKQFDGYSTSAEDGSFLYDAETGEVIDSIALPMGMSFLKVWKYPFAKALNGLGRYQITVCLYMLKQLGSNGKVYVSRMQLAQACSVSERTVRRTIQFLEAVNFLCTIHRTCFMVNPDIVCFDLQHNQAEQRTEYHQIQAENKSSKE